MAERAAPEDMRKYPRCVLKRFLLLFIFNCSNPRGGGSTAASCRTRYVNSPCVKHTFLYYNRAEETMGERMRRLEEMVGRLVGEVGELVSFHK